MSDDMKIEPLFPPGHAVNEIRELEALLAEVSPVPEGRLIDDPAPLFSAEAQDGAMGAYRRFKTGPAGSAHQDRHKLIDITEQF